MITRALRLSDIISVRQKQGEGADVETQLIVPVPKRGRFYWQGVQTQSDGADKQTQNNKPTAVSSLLNGYKMFEFFSGPGAGGRERGVLEMPVQRL